MGSVILPKNKTVYFVPSIPPNSLLTVFYLSVIFVTKLVATDSCSLVTDCICVFPNGSIIDLTSLGYHNQPRWIDIKPTLPNDSYTYSYNPCSKFSIGNGACQNVQVCQTGKGIHYNCGKEVHFSGNGDGGTTNVIYTGEGGRVTNITLVCSPEDRVPQLSVTGEVSSKHYEMTLNSRCACANLCRESHLSTGSVLVILLMIGVALYLVLGIIHSSLTRGAHGWELIPHHEFWADFPLLVRDGCVFVISGCKSETAYEKI
ncbi:uncharacterized protein NPIL_135881 [Nephila pilipes]|uniref:MRH domain-containing protein n=1 Tax=Nephila pilipes TaxID=299642 RepID=A0A8X6Q5S6_NEPPI|nr:uncharacterized protein NPIL_135881 [Nephila pilipes]